MSETIKTIGDWIVRIAGVLAACGVIWKWGVGPFKKIEATLAVIMEDIGDILCDRLNQAHDYWVKKGYCPKADKTRLLDMHKRYTNLGRNHLAVSYEQDLIRLPEHPPDH